MASLRIALAQLNPTVGDLDGNVAKIVAAYDQAEAAGCDIVAFPELAITGYPPEDLVLKPGSSPTTSRRWPRSPRTPAVARRWSASSTPTATSTTPPRCAPTARSLGTYRKRLLPNYAVFDEARYFTPGDASDPYELYVIGGVKVGISICEDVWSPTGPLAEQAAGGAELNININGSPYHFDKGVRPRADAGHPRRRRQLRARLRQPGRRPGRAGLRRRLDGVRRRRSRSSPAPRSSSRS